MLEVVYLPPLLLGYIITVRRFSSKVNYCRGEILHAYGEFAGHCGRFAPNLIGSICKHQCTGVVRELWDVDACFSIWRHGMLGAS